MFLNLWSPDSSDQATQSLSLLLKTEKKTSNECVSFSFFPLLLSNFTIMFRVQITPRVSHKCLQSCSQICFLCFLCSNSICRDFSVQHHKSHKGQSLSLSRNSSKMNKPENRFLTRHFAPLFNLIHRIHLPAVYVILQT